MNILDWFDIDNIEHLKAYKHLQETGCWPEGFLPEDIEMRILTNFRPNLLTVQRSRLASRLADRYVEEKLSGDIIKALQKVALRRLATEGLQTAGSHHKQWCFEQILIALGVDLDVLRVERKFKGYSWEPGIAP